MKVCKFDHMLKQVEEINQLVELDVAEMLEMYKEYQIADHSCFERYFRTWPIFLNAYPWAWFIHIVDSYIVCLYTLF